MLQIQNLTITHRRDLRVLLKDFSLTLNPGDKAVLIGEEGDGKSTLLKWICDPALIQDYADEDGTIILNRERPGYLPQDLSPAEKNLRVSEFFTNDPAFWEISPGTLKKAAAALGLEADFCFREQTVGSLSGGERVKAELLRLQLHEPTLLLLDEPSNDLDLDTLRVLEEYIQKFPGPVLFISHDETLIERCATMVIHLEQLRKKSVPRHTVARLSYREYLSRRAADFAHQAQNAADDRRQKQIRDEKFRRIYQKVDANLNSTSHEMHDSLGRLAKKKMHAVKSLEKRFAREDEDMTEFPEEEEPIYLRLDGAVRQVPAGKTVIEYAQSALLSRDGSRVLAKDVFLRVRGPEKIGIIGRNGVGKTTLLRELAEILLPRTDLRALYMPQNYEEELPPHLTAVDFLCESGDLSEATRIRSWLGALRFTREECEHPLTDLSGGQKAKVLLLKLSISEANVLLLDEPTRNLSPLSGPVIRSRFAEFPGCIISISHDRKFLREVCTTLYELTETGLRPAEELF